MTYQWRTTLSCIICLSAGRGGVHMHVGFWVKSKLAFNSYFAQNIHRHISEQLCIKGRVRVGWVMCHTDEWLRLVSRQGQFNPTLCVPLMRAYNVFSHMKELIPNYFNPMPVILVQCQNPKHHMLYLTTACMNDLLFGLWFYIWHASVSLVGALCAN